MKMINDPIAFFSPELMEGRILCLLPLTRVHADCAVLLCEKMVFYPANSIRPSKLRVVWEPKREYERFEAKNHAMHPEYATAEGNELHWIKSAATGVTADDLFRSGLLAFTLDLDWQAFLCPESHEAHLDVISTAAAHAEKRLNQLRFDYCRIDLPDTLPERAGLLANRQFSAGLFYRLQDNESYIIAGNVIRQRFVTGMGLELDGVSIPAFPAGETGNIAQRALQMHTDALEAPNDTAKFINLINLLEYVADPFAYLSMKKTKGTIARHVAGDRSEYEKILEDFKFLTSNAIEDKNDGLRHNIVHMGKRLEDMLGIVERKAALIRMNHYARIVIDDLLNLSDRSWSEVEQLRITYGKNLGLNT